ncbi:glycosyl transferase [Xylophilus rhododendri]|uniref:Glycosyl transferase n=1 Tax=Xylophilus rhododendri TaxID=2697032 RepID=A0A857J3V0_9BURK|nr:glycosyltransferase family 2 protein [Xylophilus rhododendri]QHI97913.1 glycosyl transferase [Xylophilus rhododendri]
MPDSAILPPSRPITVSIVSHGQLGLIAPLLVQLDRHCSTSIAKIVLTINIPEPDAPPLPPSGFPVEQLFNHQAQGFGANHDQAFGRCETPWFLVLNPDIRLNGDILSPLLAAARPDSGLLAPRILEPGRRGPEPHRGLLTPWEILTRRRPAYLPPAEPAWIPGLFMLWRSQAFQQLGGFDKRFFMYGEDFDLCARARLAGWRLQIDETLLAHHEAQRASHAALRPLAWHVASLLRIWMSSVFWRYRSLLGKG